MRDSELIFLSVLDDAVRLCNDRKNEKRKELKVSLDVEIDRPAPRPASTSIASTSFDNLKDTKAQVKEEGRTQDIALYDQAAFQNFLE